MSETKSETKKREPAHVTALRRAESKALTKLHAALGAWRDIARALSAITEGYEDKVDAADTFALAIEEVEADKEIEVDTEPT